MQLVASMARAKEIEDEALGQVNIFKITNLKSVNFIM